MKNNPVKPKITKQALFVVKKNGHQNGYGKTPKAAYLDFERRRKRKAQQAEIVKNFTLDNIEYIQKLKAELASANKALHNSTNPPRSNTEWIIYSMLATGETDVKSALEKMRGFGAKINKEDLIAADVLSRNLAQFKKNLEAQVKGRTL